MLDFDAPGALTLAADQIKAQIDAGCELPAKYDWRIKASSLGEQCLAKTWYAWRWAVKEAIPGRVARMFGRGNEAEARMITYIQKGGWQIQEFDPSKPETQQFRQWRAKAIEGHMSNYADGKCYNPEFCLSEWLLELKTMERSKFNRLVAKRSVMQCEHKYYTQVQIYLKVLNLPFCLFVAECTEDQEIYVEIIRYNEDAAARAIEVGYMIAFANIRPARVSDNPTFGMCKSCKFHDICHFETPVDKNCRSCLNCQPVANGQFFCGHWNAFIPNEAAILAACDNHDAVK